MTQFFKWLFCAIVFAVTIASCDSGETTDVENINEQTILVYMPWSGSSTNSGLYDYMQQNLDSIKSAIRSNKGLNGRALVFISTSPTTSVLFEMKYKNGVVSNDTLKTYTGNDYVTAEGITQILNDVKANAYALNYAMIIGGHGMGWTYREDWTNYPYNIKPKTTSGNPDGNDRNTNRETPLKQQYNTFIHPLTGADAPYPTTRFFGSASDLNNHAIDLHTLAEAITAAGIKMQFILFDDCYMANIETAYELRNVTNFLIASTSEVMAQGMPYQTMWTELAKQAPNYQAAVTDFYDFYSNEAYPYGALSAIDCREVEKLAQVMKQINLRDTLNSDSLSKIQVLDGFTTPIFYDLGDYVDHFCTSPDLLSDFHTQLSNVIRSTVHTDQLYSYLYYMSPTLIDVKSYSGITISDPSRNSVALKGMKKTAWWTATH